MAAFPQLAHGEKTKAKGMGTRKQKFLTKMVLRKIFKPFLFLVVGAITLIWLRFIFIPLLLRT